MNNLDERIENLGNYNKKKKKNPKDNQRTYWPKHCDKNNKDTVTHSVSWV